MRFQIDLCYPETLHTAVKDASYSPETREVIWEMCRVMNKTNDIAFYIHGISYHERMAGLQLSIDWDLAALLEQLPDVLRKIAKDDYDFRIDFYEQGSEFYLQFIQTGSEDVDVIYNSYRGDVTCSTAATKSELRSMFKKIYRDFIFLSNTICGYLYAFDDASVRSLLSVADLS